MCVIAGCGCHSRHLNADAESTQRKAWRQLGTKGERGRITGASPLANGPAARPPAARLHCAATSRNPNLTYRISPGLVAGSGSHDSTHVIPEVYLRATDGFAAGVAELADAPG